MILYLYPIKYFITWMIYTNLFLVSRNTSNSTDILQHNARLELKLKFVSNIIAMKVLTEKQLLSCYHFFYIAVNYKFIINDIAFTLYTM